MSSAGQDGSNARWARYGFWAVAVMAVGYAPLAINYMWRYFADGTLQLQASATSALDGRAYAVGYGSVDWARGTAYEHDRWVMLIHTVLGGLCLILGIAQFAPQVRRRWPRAHRWTGRIYLPAMSVCMLTAMAFLVYAGPVTFFSGGPAFFLQLWALALGTLVTGWLGFAMIKRRDLVAHQGFMMLSFALMMTAPGLRVLWTAIHPLFPHAILLQNLGASAVAEGVLAPTCGVAAFILTRRSRTVGTVDRRARPIYWWASLTGLAGAAAIAVRVVWSLPRAFPGELLAMYLVPLVLAAALSVGMALRARRAGRAGEERHWRMLFLGLAVNPLLVNLTWLLALPFVSQTDACLASLMVTSAVPILVAGAAVINDASPRGLAGRVRTRPTPEAVLASA